jgi:poly(glycerol-phosphate) alpha-glucosyltransferase
MSVLEAWSYGLPVLMTDFCNLPEGFSTNAAIRIKPTPNSITSGLETLVLMDESALLSMGQRGRALAKQRFTWPKIALNMLSVYWWILGQGRRPDCVMIP